MSILLRASESLKRMLTDGFRPRNEMDLGLDEAFDKTTAQMMREMGGGERTVSPAGIALIKRFEGCERMLPGGMVAAYPDPASGGAPWTIGWGSTGPDIGPDTVWTRKQCEERFLADLDGYASEVRSAIGTAPTTQGQFDAMVSFAYNLGPESLRRSTLLRKHMEGDYEGAAREFSRWNRAAGKVMPGLTRRRAAEAAMYQGDV